MNINRTIDNLQFMLESMQANGKVADFIYVAEDTFDKMCIELKRAFDITIYKDNAYMYGIKIKVIEDISKSIELGFDVKEDFMKIQLDDKHALNSDAYCYWITTLVEPDEKDGKKARPYEKRVSGYTRTFSESVISYIESALRRSEATEIIKLSEEVERLKEQVSKWEDLIYRK